jgi:hypothetical protein
MYLADCYSIVRKKLTGTQTGVAPDLTFAIRR